MDGDCDSSTGQVYARSGWLKNGNWGIMYSWYFPKNQNKDLLLALTGGVYDVVSWDPRGVGFDTM